MRILVIEDDEDKLEDLVGFLAKQFSFSNVRTAKSLHSGVEAALQDDADLVLLDMTMRNFDRTVTDDGGRPHHFAGREILRQMRRNSINTPVIIVTHFHRFGDESDFTTLDELKDELASKFANYVGTVQYRGDVEEWRGVLAAMIQSVLEE